MTLCSIDGCTKPIFCRRWCAAHYTRWKRYGSADAIPPKLRPRAFIEKLASHDGDDCVLWPFSRNEWGYGTFGRTDGSILVHRALCEQINGPPPTPQHHARHLCGNGHLGCVNPRHLAWGTAKENTADAISHGTAIRGRRVHTCRLSESQVREIRDLARNRTMTRRCIAQKYGVGVTAVTNISLGTSWAWLA